MSDRKAAGGGGGGEESATKLLTHFGRFVLICNYVTRIISPLGSRCAKFRFKPLEPSTIVKRLGEIGSAEGCTFENSEETFGRIVELSGGDMRRAVTMLQCAHSLCVNGSKIKTSDVEEMSGEIPKEVR